jgi:hypothetical protein
MPSPDSATSIFATSFFLFRSGSRRQIRQHFHPGTLYIPSEHYRTDAKPPAASEYSVFKETLEWRESGFLGPIRKYCPFTADFGPK